MPWSTKKPTAIEIAPDWLKPYCEVDQGYAPATMRTYEGAARLLCEEVARRGLRKGEFVGRTLSATQAAALKAMHPNKYDQKRYCLERFIDALIEAGVGERPMEKKKQKAPTRLDRLKTEYESYLRDQRALTDATIYHCVRFLDRFMTFRFGEKLGDFDKITPHDVVEFIRKLAAAQLLATKQPHRTCATCSASCSGAARRSATSRRRSHAPGNRRGARCLAI
jgi:hypothetical protein